MSLVRTLHERDLPMTAPIVRMRRGQSHFARRNLRNSDSPRRFSDWILLLQQLEFQGAEVHVALLLDVQCEEIAALGKSATGIIPAGGIASSAFDDANHVPAVNAKAAHNPACLLNEIMVSPRCLDSRSRGKTDRRLPSYADNAAPSINRRSNLNKVVVTDFGGGALAINPRGDIRGLGYCTSGRARLLCRQLGRGSTAATPTIRCGQAALGHQ